MREQITIAVGLFVTAVGAICGAYYFYGKGADTSDIIAGVSAFVGFVMGLVGLVLLSRRTNLLDRQTTYQSKQIQIQIDKEIDDRFTAAVNLLGNAHTSARTGAMYSLYHLAVENDKYRKEVPQILCSHIRSVTGEVDYQKTHARQPSNEIQTALDLLFKRGVRADGLYSRFESDLISGLFPQADLSGAYLVGARFENMTLVCANFHSANCANSYFVQSNCQRADFFRANLAVANFIHVQCYGARFTGARCHGMKMKHADCHFANFTGAICPGVEFHDSAFCGGIFWDAIFPGADYSRANFRGANDNREYDATDGASTQWGRGVRMFFDFNTGKELERFQEMKSFLPSREYILVLELLKCRAGKSHEGRTDPTEVNIKVGEGDDSQIIVGKFVHTDEIRAIVSKLKRLDELYPPFKEFV